ncbi:integrase catalytic region [Nitrospirillum viridazoti Y2]|nr:integrase catalytic region [Nitrospirillum amazonense Y2]
MQLVLDQYLVGYNTRRPCQGRGMKGRAPLQAFRDGIPKQPNEVPEANLKLAARKPHRRGVCQGISVSVHIVRIDIISPVTPAPAPWPNL